MRIAILGLGYVGSTMAACLLRDGHHVLGIDVNPEKVAPSAPAARPWSSRGWTRCCAPAWPSGRLRSARPSDAELDGRISSSSASARPRAATASSISHTARGHPAARPGGAGSAGRAAPLLIVIRSTIPPGTMDRLVLPILERRPRGRGRASATRLAFNPEFLRESTAVKDYFAPPKIVIGERGPGITRRLLGIYDGLDGPCFEVPFAAAEMVKLVDNSWHALKVTFANEVGRLCVSRGIEPQAVADIFLADTKLNISPAYLRPGGPYGGSCLPKDLGGDAGAGPRGRAVRAGAGGSAREQRAASRLARCSAIRARPRRRDRSCCWACRSRPAPTTCATARCSIWPSSCSRPATISTCTTRTSIRPGCWVPISLSAPSIASVLAGQDDGRCRRRRSPPPVSSCAASHSRRPRGSSRRECPSSISSLWAARLGLKPAGLPVAAADAAAAGRTPLADPVPLQPSAAADAPRRQLTVAHLLEFLHARGHEVDFVTLVPAAFGTAPEHQAWLREPLPAGRADRARAAGRAARGQLAACCAAGRSRSACS